MRASSLAITRSAHSAMSLPPPTHQPWTWAITGLGERHRLMNRGTAPRLCEVAAAKSLPGSHAPSVVSALVPVMKAVAEVEARAERAPGAAQDDHLDLRIGDRARPPPPRAPRGIGGTIVFRRSGRFSVIVAIASSVS